MCGREKIKAGDQEASEAATEDQWRMKPTERTAGSADENKTMSRSSDGDLEPRGRAEERAARKSAARRKKTKRNS